ncbi:MAG TPA: hypothetical protein VHD85_00455 [Terracidiphilus sp.]|nr:hypothetical protein [Terracidiphilus sp.]
MSDPVKSLKAMSLPPTDESSFNTWLQLEDAIEFLRQNTRDEQFVLYANMPNVFIHAVLVPTKYLAPLDINDIMSWNCNAYSTWGIVTSSHPVERIEIVPPLHGTGSQTLDKGEQLVFCRVFEGRVGEKGYIEVFQKFLHVSDLHYLRERNAYCKLDSNGDVQAAVSVTSLPKVAGQRSGGEIVTVTREILDRYAAITEATIVRTFDFTRVRGDHFSGWRESHSVAVTELPNLFFRSHIEAGHASYARGFQVVSPSTSKQNIIDEFRPGIDKDARYESFIALDWKNRIVREISCAPGGTANYYTPSELPFELSPAFFRAEVLSKYKADSDKYRLDERTISCRGAWSLQSYDVNEAGQVHTYIIYLRYLPHQEQLHWKAHNEPPKGTISRRAFLSDFEGSWDQPYDSLESVKEHVRKLTDECVPWWTPRSENTADRAHYPITASPDEWANEILNLDQLLVEPFEKKWFSNELSKLGKVPDDPNLGSLALAELCFAAWGEEPSAAKESVAPLRVLHDLRSKLRGHAVGKDTKAKLRQQALDEHGNYRAHYTALCKACDDSLRRITKMIGDRQAEAKRTGNP